MMMMWKTWTGISLVAVITACSSADESQLESANRPKAYKTICRLDETCSVPQETEVAFGASGAFAYKILKGNFLCTAATFGGDPAPSKKAKECSVPLNSDEAPRTVPALTLQSAIENNQVSLSWNILQDSKNFIVLRNSEKDPAGRIRIATLPAAASTYIDRSVRPGQEYWYWVNALQKNDSLVESNSAFIKVTNPNPPLPQADECQAGATIKNKTVDCGGKTIGLSCNADSESQPPVLTLINASVKNVRIAANGGSDGIHCKGGDCTLENVVWEDICEDAATNKSEGGTMTIIGGSVYNDATGPGGKPDKIFQHNSKNSTTIVTGGFTVKGLNGKLWRSCGDCEDNGGPRSLIVDDVIIEGTIAVSVAGANQNYGDRVKIRNLRIKDYKPGKTRICEEYRGVNKGQGSSLKLGEVFETPTCDVRRSDIISF